MSPLLNRARAALALICSGAMVGAMEQVVVDSFGATIESMVLPWCAWLFALTLARLSPRPISFLHDQAWTRWLAIAIATTAVLAGPLLTDQLAALVGAFSLPRTALPILWTLLATLAFRCPAAFFPAPSVARGPALLLGLGIGFMAPPSIAALVVGGAAVGVLLSGGPMARPAAPLDNHPLTRAVRVLATAGMAMLGTHCLVILQPPLDPSPAPLLAAMAGATIVAPFPSRRASLGAWWALITVGAVAAVAALALPHVVGIGRLTHTSLAGWLPPDWSPSSGPALVGLACGVAFGLLGCVTAPSSHARAEIPFAIAAGLLLGLLAVNPSGQLVVGVAALAIAIALLLAGSRSVQGAAIALATLLAAVVWRGTVLPVDVLVLSPISGLRNAEAWITHLDRSLDLVPGQTRLNASGTGTVLAAPEDWRASGRAGAMLPFEADVAGRVGRPAGRRAEAEVMAGMLAGMLAPRLDRVLLLNDDVGSALAGLAPFAAATVDVATPVPHVIQDIARLVPLRRDRWLAPGIRLWPEHPASVLRRAPQPAAIVDTAHGSWLDGAHTSPSPRHFAAVHDALGDFGVYVLCLHLDNFEPGTPAHIATDLVTEFGYAQLWLPPSGADSILLVASGRPLPLQRLEARADAAVDTLRGLGFPNAVALASMAIGDADSIVDWNEQKSSVSPRWRLNSGLQGSIPLHLASFAPLVSAPDRTWDLSDARTGGPALTSRLDTRRRFLELLDDASRGNVAGALDKARELANDDGGDRALRALVGPHLENARRALALAVQEGPSSTAWADVHRFATTAQMIAPTSHEPLLILGTMSLAQGDLKGAQNHFGEAEKRADGNLDALSGMARVARLRGDTVSAEQYFREAATANPREWLAWHRLGVFLTETNRFDEAETVLERSVGLASGTSPAPVLALARLYLLDSRPTPALVHAERALVVGANAEGYFLRGLAYRDLDQLENAERDFRQTVLADPTFATAHGEIGRIRAVKGDKPAAEEAWKAVLRIDPNNASARENLRRLGIDARNTESEAPQ